MSSTNFSRLTGEVIREIRGADKGSDVIVFVCESGRIFEMYHEQDCCERVSVEDIAGDIDSVMGEPVLGAWEASSDDPNASESGSWTFYTIRTVTGTIVIRWYGYSNGYYSESVSFRETTPVIAKEQDPEYPEYIRLRAKFEN